MILKNASVPPLEVDSLWMCALAVRGRGGFHGADQEALSDREARALSSQLWSCFRREHDAGTLASLAPEAGVALSRSTRRRALRLK